MYVWIVSLMTKQGVCVCRKVVRLWHLDTWLSCLLLSHYVRWAFSLWGSVTLTVIGKVILLLPQPLTAKWHINDNITEWNEITGAFLFLSQGWPVCIWCSIALQPHLLYSPCWNVNILYGWSTAHVDTLITNSSRCFSISIPYGAEETWFTSFPFINRIWFFLKLD